jgi:hypothetical protein
VYPPDVRSIALVIVCSLGGTEGCGDGPTSTPATPQSEPDVPVEKPSPEPAPEPRSARTTEPHSGEGYFKSLIRLSVETDDAEPIFVDQDVVFVSRDGADGCERLARVPMSGLEDPSPFGPSDGRTVSPVARAGTLAFAWSPDGCATPPRGQVWRLDPAFDVFVRPVDGSSTRRSPSQSPAYDAEVDLSPDGQTIVFTTTRDTDPELWRANVDGTEARRLTHARGFDGGARFGPKGEWIYWRANRPEGQHELDAYATLVESHAVIPVPTELWRMRADGSDARRLTRDGALAFAIAPHPSGRFLVFASNRGSDDGTEIDLWRLELDDPADPQRVTHSPGFDAYPRFSPSGDRLVFASNRGSAGEADARPVRTSIYIAEWTEPVD